MRLISNVLLFIGAVSISIQDLKEHKIRNQKVLILFICLVLLAILTNTFTLHFLSGLTFIAIFALLYLAGKWFPSFGTIGFGDVKLVSVMAFGYVDFGKRSAMAFLLFLWLALILQIGIQLIHQRKIFSRMAMAPSIFFAIALYLYAPIQLHLSQ